MGTHPIFESDFDCLTEMMLRRLATRVPTQPRKFHWVRSNWISTYIDTRVPAFGFEFFLALACITPFMQWEVALTYAGNTFSKFRGSHCWKTWGYFRCED